MNTFAATPTTAGQRLLVERAIRRGWSLHTGDVSTAFLHADLPAEAKVYIIPPPSEQREGQVWRLRKALYGLREAPRLFQEHLAKVLAKHGFRRLIADPQLFVHEATDSLVSVFADDILICAADEHMEEIKGAMQAELKIKWGALIREEPVKYLGREWLRTETGYVVRTPEKYWQETLVNSGMQNCRALSTPAEVGSPTPDNSPQLEARDHARYRSLVGRVMWTLGERPDLAFACKELARHVQHPTERDMQRMKRMLRYLRGSRSMCLHLGEGFVGDKDEISVMTDANWASGEGRRSTSGGIIFYGGVVIATWSRTQSVVALSSCESELLAVGVGAQEGKHVQSILQELGIVTKLKIYCDSSSARQLIGRRGVGRLKHMEVREFWLQDEARAGRLEIRAVSSLNNLADLLTKAFARARFESLCELIGLQYDNDDEEE